MDKSVTTFQPIESNARPCCQSVLPNVVVLDLDSVENGYQLPRKFDRLKRAGKLPIRPCICLWILVDVAQRGQTFYSPGNGQSYLSWEFSGAELREQTHLIKLNSSTTSGTFEYRYTSPPKSGSTPLLVFETHLYFPSFFVESSDFAFSFPYCKSHFTYG